MSGLVIRNFTSATSVHYHGGLPYDEDGALLVSQGYCIAQRYDGWVRQSAAAAGDASYVVMTSVSLPALTMGKNSRLFIVSDWDLLTTGTKSLGIDFGGANLGGVTNISGSVVTVNCETDIKNKNSLSSQFAFNAAGSGVQTIPRATAAIDTAGAVKIDFKSKWSAQQADALQTITLVGYSIWHFPGT